MWEKFPRGKTPPSPSIGIFSTKYRFLSDPGLSTGPIYGSSCLKLSQRRFVNFTDVTPADEDTNSILTDKVNRTIQGNVAKQL